MEFLLTLSKVANDAPSPVLSFQILSEHTSMETLITYFNVQLNSALNILEEQRYLYVCFLSARLVAETQYLFAK